jgi:hypothetical protein
MINGDSQNYEINTNSASCPNDMIRQFQESAIDYKPDK